MNILRKFFHLSCNFAELCHGAGWTYYCGQDEVNNTFMISAALARKCFNYLICIGGARRWRDFVHKYLSFDENLHFLIRKVSQLGEASDANGQRQIKTSQTYSNDSKNVSADEHTCMRRKRLRTLYKSKGSKSREDTLITFERVDLFPQHRKRSIFSVLANKYAAKLAAKLSLHGVCMQMEFPSPNLSP